jgi:hypothetical protein
VGDAAAAAPFLVLGGIAWVGVQSTWMTLAHQALPDWVRPRVIALLLLLFQGTQAVGALLWGVIADAFGLSHTLLAAAALMTISIIVLLRSGLGSSLGIEPVAAPPDATTMATVATATHDGELEVAWTYVVAAGCDAEFVTAMDGLRRQRLRLGARDWRLDVVDGQTLAWTETYAVADREDLLEQETIRLTVPEQRVRDAVVGWTTRVEGPRLEPRTATVRARPSRRRRFGDRARSPSSDRHVEKMDTA